MGLSAPEGWVGNNLRGVRSTKWKLVFEKTRQGETTTLYDLESDIGEMDNVIAEHPDVAKRLHALADTIGDDIGDHRTKRSDET